MVESTAFKAFEIWWDEKQDIAKVIGCIKLIILVRFSFYFG